MYIDLLIKIKNAKAARKKSLKTIFTKMDFAIGEILKKHDFIKNIEIKGRAPKRFIQIEVDSKRKINGLKLLNRPSVRIYSGYDDLRKVKSGYGLLVLSTSKGVLSGEEAKKEKVGGQLLFEIW